MTKRQKVLLLVAALAALAMVAPLSFHPRSSMPTYKGRSLTEWARLLEGTPSPQSELEAAAAIRAICPQRIPTLIARLDYDPRPRAARLHQALRWLPAPIGSWLMNGPLEDRQELRATVAQIALGALGPHLGPEVAPAAPRLAQLVNRTNAVISARAIWVASRLAPGILTNVPARPHAQTPAR